MREQELWCKRIVGDEDDSLWGGFRRNFEVWCERIVGDDFRGGCLLSLMFYLSTNAD